MSHKSFLESNFLKFDLEIYKKNLEYFYSLASTNRKNKKIAEGIFAKSKLFKSDFERIVLNLLLNFHTFNKKHIEYFLDFCFYEFTLTYNSKILVDEFITISCIPGKSKKSMSLIGIMSAFNCKEALEYLCKKGSKLNTKDLGFNLEILNIFGLLGFTVIKPGYFLDMSFMNMKPNTDFGIIDFMINKNKKLNLDLEVKLAKYLYNNVVPVGDREYYRNMPLSVNIKDFVAAMGYEELYIYLDNFSIAPVYETGPKLPSYRRASYNRLPIGSPRKNSKLPPSYKTKSSNSWVRISQNSMGGGNKKSKKKKRL